MTLIWGFFFFLIYRCFTVDGNRWHSKKRHNGSSRELHVTHNARWRSVKSCWLFIWPFGFVLYIYPIFFNFISETWQKFKEEGENLSKSSQTTICEDGIREMVTFLNPKQIEDVCSPWKFLRAFPHPTRLTLHSDVPTSFPVTQVVLLIYDTVYWLIDWLIRCCPSCFNHHTFLSVLLNCLGYENCHGRIPVGEKKEKS